ERGQAVVKVREERKRRRLLILAGMLLLLLVTGAAAGGLWYQHRETLWAEEQTRQQQAQTLRLAHAAHRVREALKEATTLADSAGKMVQQPESWKATLKAAFAALLQAETLVQKEPDLNDSELHEQVQKVKTRLEADERDRVLLAAFDKVREEQ